MMAATMSQQAPASMPSLLMQAAESAAQADGLAPPPASIDGTMINSASAGALERARSAIVAASGNGTGGAPASKKNGPPLRRGKWTPEEEAYANRLIQEFKAGLLPLTDGTTLRTFLSKLLNCDPMRISKKFVGRNCIGKQVFRRRNADLNGLTSDQIQQSRADLSELERRFLERIAQTNRRGGGSGGSTKSPKMASTKKSPAPGPMPPSSAISGNMMAAAAVGRSPLANPMSSAARRPSALKSALKQTGKGDDAGSASFAGMMFPGQSAGGMGEMLLGGGTAADRVASASGQDEQQKQQQQQANLWLSQFGLRQGLGASFASTAANPLAANSRAAAAGRALLEGASASNPLRDAMENNSRAAAAGRALLDRAAASNQIKAALERKSSLLALQELQKRVSQSNLMQSALGSGSASNLLAAAAQSGTNAAFSNSAVSQLAQRASAARLASLASNTSMSNLMLRAGLSRDQLATWAREQTLSSTSLSNMFGRKNSMSALMGGLDPQSLQSIDNLANLMQSGGQGLAGLPQSGMKNADFGFAMAAAAPQPGAASAVTAAAAGNDTTARRLASAGRMESLLKSMTAGNALQNNQSAAGGTSLDAGANLRNFLEGLRSKGDSAAASSLLGAAASSTSGQSAVDLANLLRQESSTGLSALRMQDGLNARNSSVDDFLSLVAAGDIKAPDASLLNTSLLQQKRQDQAEASASAVSTSASQQEAAVKFFAQQQMLASGNSALANAFASHSLASSLQNGAALSNLQQLQAAGSGAKRKLEDLVGELEAQGNLKR